MSNNDGCGCGGCLSTVFWLILLVFFLGMLFGWHLA